jgi:hypothetical protein
MNLSNDNYANNDDDDDDDNNNVKNLHKILISLTVGFISSLRA